MTDTTPACTAANLVTMNPAMPTGVVAALRARSADLPPDEAVATLFAVIVQAEACIHGA